MRINLPPSTTLFSGRTYRVRVVIQKDGSLLLEMGKAAGGTRAGEAGVNQLPLEPAVVLRSGISHDVLEILGKSGLLPSPLLAGRISTFLRERDPDRMGRALLALILGKRILPERETFDLLLPLLGWDQGSDTSGEDTGQRWNRKHHKEKPNGSGGDERKAAHTAGAVKAAVQARSDQPSLLHLFNALASPEGQWVIIPLPEQVQGRESIYGHMGLLIHPLDGRLARMLLSLVDSDGQEYHFKLNYPDNGGSPRLSCYLPEQYLGAFRMQKGREFIKKMDNLGLKIDDIEREDSFTGYGSDLKIPGGIDVEA